MKPRIGNSPPLDCRPLAPSSSVSSKSRSVREMFESIAPRYDFLNHFLSAGMDIAWRRAAARAMRESLVSPGSKALDICSGTGDLAAALARVAAGAVVGADFCPPMLLRAKAKFSGRGRRLALVAADALCLPFRDGSFEVVSSAFGFRNLADYDLGLAELRRVLSPGGRLGILEFSRVQWPVFGSLFRLYFGHVLPRLGTWISGVPGPYQYLHDSVSRFPDQDTLARKIEAAGFSEVRYTNFMGGVAALHTGKKADGGQSVRARASVSESL